MFSKGDSITVKIPYTANPKPSDEWTKDGNSIDSDSSYRLDLSENYATLSIKNADLNHTGVYELKLSNQLGSDSCKIRLQILDVPDAPKSVAPDEVSSESIRLVWEAPANDGGSEITAYFIERADVTASPIAVWQRSGLSHTTSYYVENLEEKHKYQFRVIAENAQGRSKPSEPSDVISTKGMTHFNSIQSKSGLLISLYSSLFRI